MDISFLFIYNIDSLYDMRIFDMSKIFVTSDLHFGHNRDFIYGSRGFPSVEAHDNAIIENWNSVVSDEDEVYILGDLMLGNNEKGIEKIKRLKGIKHIILGNHDSEERQALYRTVPDTDILGYANVLKYNGYSIYFSHYPSLTSNYDDGVDLKKNVINLCGHAHTIDRFADFDLGIIYHCELDAHYCEPKLLDEIIEDIQNQL